MKGLGETWLFPARAQKSELLALRVSLGTMGERVWTTEGFMVGGSLRACVAPGVLTETTAELAVALTFAAARRVVEADRFMRKGFYLGWAPTLMVGQLLQVRQHFPAHMPG